MPKPDTSSVAVQLTLSSLHRSSPFNITDCKSIITDVNGQQTTYKGWDPQDVGKPQHGGADFTLTVHDDDYSANNPTMVGRWVLTCLRRGATRDASPFSANAPSIAGEGADVANGVFTLDLNQAKIKNAGSWDWSLLIQMVMPNDTATKCFVSDPEMDVQAVVLT